MQIRNSAAARFNNNSRHNLTLLQYLYFPCALVLIHRSLESNNRKERLIFRLKEARRVKTNRNQGEWHYSARLDQHVTDESGYIFCPKNTLFWQLLD